jgi:hypothetical protein
MPKVHYEENRGYALTDGGYYFAVSDYFDLALQEAFIQMEHG